MHVATHQAELPLIGIGASLSAPIIVATDGREQSDSALAMGAVLAGSAECLRVVSVIKALPIIPEAPFGMTPDVQGSTRTAMRDEVVAQMARTSKQPPSALELLDGDPARAIAHLARQTGAAMIVTGLGRHHVSDRMFGDETALRMSRMAVVPVFAASHDIDHAPRRIVVAVDFSESSVRAARVAMQVAAPGAVIYLVHVAPSEHVYPQWKTVGEAYDADADIALQRARSELDVPAGLTAKRVTLKGDPATELLAFATTVHADLMATGSQGQGFVARLLLGSVTTRILRHSTCSVLTVPHASSMLVSPPSVPRDLTVAESDWATALGEFSQRNMGRRGTLEVDDPEIGSQIQEFDYPLRGAAYDTHDRRVDLMFGELGDVSRHLTRGIAGVTAIDVVRDERGRDRAIRLAHGAGQTLLTFAS